MSPPTEGHYVRDEQGNLVLDKGTKQPIWHGPARAEVEYWKHRAMQAEHADDVDAHAVTTLERVMRYG